MFGKSLSNGRTVLCLASSQNFLGNGSFLTMKFHRLFVSQTADKPDTINFIFLWDIWKSTFPVGRDIFKKVSFCPVHCALDKVYSKASLCCLLRLHLSWRAVTLVGKLDDIFGPEKLQDSCVTNEIHYIIRRYFIGKNKQDCTFLKYFFGIFYTLLTFTFFITDKTC
jgi:hypothetical protein